MIADTLPKILAYMRANGERGRKGKAMQIISMCQPTIRPHLHPTNITQTVNIFSVSVLGATFPNPTEVNEVKVKYSAVMYRDCGRQGRQRARVRDARLTMISEINSQFRQRVPLWRALLCHWPCTLDGCPWPIGPTSRSYHSESAVPRYQWRTWKSTGEGRQN